MSLNCQDLAARIESAQPDARPADVARLCLLLINHVNDIGSLEEDEALADAWQEMGMRLQAATDQHAAMTEELEEISLHTPSEFTREHVWILLRAIKVQSQVLQLYLGNSLLDA
ncbi:MAG: hypothetical protein ACYC6Y_03505 [Thermoguttaceae bacterium]